MTETKLQNIEKIKGNESKDLSDKQFAAEIRRLRTLKGLSQEDLGALVFEKQTIISRIEAANYGITLDIVMRLAAALKTDPHRLADIYWGTSITEYRNTNAEALDRIWEIMETYYLPTHLPTTTPNIRTEHTKHNLAAFDKARKERDEREATQDTQPETNEQHNEDITNML